MAHIDFHSPSTLPTFSGFSHVAGPAAGSRLVWTAGQVSITADGNLAHAGDWEGQTRQVMRNVEAALEAGGATWADVFKLTIFVVDASALPIIRAVRDEFINTDSPPTNSLVQVAGLFRPELLSRSRQSPPWPHSSPRRDTNRMSVNSAAIHHSGAGSMHRPAEAVARRHEFGLSA